MSQESFTCCDNPDCAAAIVDHDSAREGWWSACFSRYCDGDDLPNIDACSRECLVAAIAAFDYDAWARGEVPDGE